MSTCVALGAYGILGTARAEPTFATPVSLGTINVGPLRQASGIALSRVNPDVLWTHNDAGDSARIFALDTQGRELGTYTLAGGNIDYEDIAVGPGPVPEVSYLFVADIGDNNANRSDVRIYRIPEPAVYLRQSTNPRTVSIKGQQTITLIYPDGAHNAEAILVDPLTGDLFITTKLPGISRIYTATKAQLDPGGTVPLSFVREIPFDVASGGAVSPTGAEIIIRQEDFALLWQRAPGQTVGDALGGTPVSVPVVGRPTEDNGEAIGFDPLGRGYYTLSDSSSTQPLYYFARTSAFPFTAPRILIAPGTTWRYLDTGIDPGTAWRQPAFSDTAWKIGDGPFGYGDGDEQTTVSYGGASGSKFITTYFRKTFTVTGATAIGGLALKMQFDDGAAVYLNGNPVVRANLPAGALYNTPASSVQEDLEDTWFTYPIAPSLLVNGTNTIAVEVHQQASNSPDLSFDLQLLAYDPLPLRTAAITKLATGYVRLHVTGTPMIPAQIEASPNLVDWTLIGTSTLNAGNALFEDRLAPSYPQRFYRLR